METCARFADAMRQHAVALLMRHTNELKTLAELRAYASSLVLEIEQMYVSDVGAGKTGHDLQSRLKGNVDYARSIYANRVALEGADAAALLDDQLATLIEAQHATPFGADLASIVGRVERSSVRRSLLGVWISVDPSGSLSSSPCGPQQRSDPRTSQIPDGVHGNVTVRLAASFE